MKNAAKVKKMTGKQREAEEERSGIDARGRGRRKKVEETRGYKDGEAGERKQGGLEMEKQFERRMSDVKKWD